jgi:hypothetical protein
MFRSSLAPKTDISFRDLRDGHLFLHNFPALRTGRLSVSPSGTSLHILLNPMLTRMGEYGSVTYRFRYAPSFRQSGSDRLCRRPILNATICRVHMRQGTSATHNNAHAASFGSPPGLEDQTPRLTTAEKDVGLEQRLPRYSKSHRPVV